MEGTEAIDVMSTGYEPGIDPAVANEFRAARRELLLEKKALILYGTDIHPSKWNPALADLSMKVLAELLGYVVDELAAAIITFQNDTIIRGGDQDLVLAFRGGGKSTMATVVRAIWYTVRDPNIRILFASETEDVSISFLDEVKGHLIENKDLVAMFGEFMPATGDPRKKWDARRTTIRQRTKVLREPTFTCLGIGSQAASRHFDVIFPDDLVTIRNSRTKTQRANLGHWHDSTLQGVTMAHTRFHYVGTRYFPRDLWERLVKGRDNETTGPLADNVLVYPAVTKTKTGKLKSTCPSRFPLPVLLRKRRNMGSFHFNAQYQQDTTAMEGDVFAAEDFGAYDPREAYWKSVIAESAVFLFFDLVAKKTETGDFFSGTAVAIPPDKSNILILDNVQKRIGMRGQRRIIMKWCKRFLPVTCGIEAVQMQAGFAEEIGQITAYPIDPVPVSKDKVWNATRVQPLVEAGKVLVPVMESAAGERVAGVVEEMCEFPNGDFDDRVDSTVGAIYLAMYGAPGFADAGADDPNDNPDLEDVFTLRAKY